MTIIERERNELICQLSLDGPDCPESMFIQQSLDLLEARQNDIMKLLKKAVNPQLPTEINEIIAKINETDINSNAEANPTSVPLPDIYNPDFVIDEQSNLTLNDIAITPSVSDSKYFYFYQASDGQHLYMHSINVRMLQTMNVSLDKSPNMIRGKILQKESCSMTEILRKRLKYLQHLPVTSQFEVVEIGFDETTISPEVLAKFKGFIFLKH